MGGLNETYVGSLRMHVNGDVHIHDDSRNMKFEMKPSLFKAEVQKALSALGQDGGVYAIYGKTEVSLLLIKDGVNLSMVLSQGSTVRKELNSFMNKL